MNDPVILSVPPMPWKSILARTIGAGVAGPTINRFVMVHMKGLDLLRSIPEGTFVVVELDEKGTVIDLRKAP